MTGQKDLEQSLGLLDPCIQVALAELISTQQQHVNNLNISHISVSQKETKLL